MLHVSLVLFSPVINTESSLLAYSESGCKVHVDMISHSDVRPRARENVQSGRTGLFSHPSSEII